MRGRKMGGGERWGKEDYGEKDEGKGDEMGKKDGRWEMTKDISAQRNSKSIESESRFNMPVLCAVNTFQAL